MTASGQRFCVENVAAPDPMPGQAQATASLPPGWGFFRSESVRQCDPAQWYATAPWDVLGLVDDHPELFEGGTYEALDNTVSAESWARLVIEVDRQAELYAQLMAEVTT
jgi:hypothetical protein